jgi:aspartyl protease
MFLQKVFGYGFLCSILVGLAVTRPVIAHSQTPETEQVHCIVVKGSLVQFTGSIGGLHGLKFILDTGAVRSMVDKQMAARLGTHLRTRRLFDYNRYIKVSEGDFTDVKFGPVSVASAPLLVTDLSQISSFANGADAIIGADLLSRTALTIDYDRQLLIFRLPTASLASKSFEMRR